jgi:hypothetical protein
MSVRFGANIAQVLRALVTVRFFLFLNAAITFDGGEIMDIPLQLIAWFFLIIETPLLIGIWKMSSDSETLARAALVIWSFGEIFVMMLSGLVFNGWGLIMFVSVIIILASIVPSVDETEVKEENERIRAVCPHCGSSYSYQKSAAVEGSLACQNCGNTFAPE